MLEEVEKIVMKLFLFFSGFGILFTISALFGFAGGKTRPLKLYSADDFYQTVMQQGVQFSWDEQFVYITSNSVQHPEVFRIHLRTHKSEQITHDQTGAAQIVSGFKTDERILFTRDTEGNEFSHLFVREKDGNVHDLTPGRKLRAEFLSFNQEGSVFWVLTNERTLRNFDLYQYSSENYSRKLIFKNTQDWQISGMSPNGRWLVLRREKSELDIHLYVWDRENPKNNPYQLSTQEGEAEEQFKTFSPDSEELYYTTDQFSEFKEAWKFNLATQQHVLVSGGKWSVADLKFSRKGRYRMIYKNEGSQYRAFIRDTVQDKDLKLPNLPGQMIDLSFSPSENLLAFYLDGDASPSDLHILNLSEMKLTRLTQNLNPKISRDDLVEGELVHYASFDGLEIPAILYRPQQATQTHPVPAMVWVHGGPGSLSMKSYDPLIQYLVNHGIAVLPVNHRGSFGYGKTFYRASDRRHGDLDLKDCVWGKNYLQTLDWVQKENIGIMGSSYGGYLTVAALAFTPFDFKIGIDFFGVTNWLRTLKQLPPWWSSKREVLYGKIGDPIKDQKALQAMSPLFHAEKIKRPLLVIQGANDARVLRTESDELVLKLKQNQIPVEYLLFPDEGHHFTKKKNKIRASEAVLKFILKHFSVENKE